MEDKLSIDKIADEFLGKYGVSEERTEWLLDVVSCRILFKSKNPFKYVFNEQQQLRESYRIVNRYLGIEKARNDKYDSRMK